MRTSLLLAVLIIVVVGAFTLTLAEEKRPVPPLQDEMKSELRAPEPLVIEHQEIQAELSALLAAGPKTAAAAAQVSSKLHQHFMREQQFALPPLGALKKLAYGENIRKPKQLIDMSEQLKNELEQMLLEHQALTTAADRLAASGKEEKNESAIQFAEKLKRHTKVEEEVLYPAAVLMGEYLKLKLMDSKLPSYPDYRRDFLVKK